jgi:hypothetical protein
MGAIGLSSVLENYMKEVKPKFRGYKPSGDSYQVRLFSIHSF